MVCYVLVVMAMILPASLWSAGPQATGEQDAGYIVNHYFDAASGDAFGYARIAVTETAARLIEPNHLVLGILRADPSAISRFMRSDWTLKRLEAAVFWRDP